MSRARSFWGWGYADKFPDLEAREGMASVIEQMLGFGGLQARPAPTLEGLQLPPSRLQAPASLGDFCTADKEARAHHTHGRGFPDIYRGFSGDFQHAPDLVATPADEDQIAALLTWASAQGVAVVPFGGGTSVVGGVSCDVEGSYQGVVSLSMHRLDRLLSYDERSMLAHIQAGARGPRVEEQLQPLGMTLRHFPQSFEFSTLGGWIATRAGGHFATLYTHIDELVHGIRMLTPQGVIETPSFPASGAGPEPKHLLLGSEGIFGVITSAQMRVRPRPQHRSRASVHFADFSQAVEAVRTLVQSGLNPTNCRLLDAREAALHNVTDDGANVLLLAFESAQHPTEVLLTQAVDLCLSFQGTLPRPPRHTQGDRDQSGSADSSSSWRDAFLEGPYLMNSLISMGVIVDTFETACTWERFDALHKDVIRSVRDAMKAHCGQGRITCRFTHVYPDGPAPYYTFLAPAPEGADTLETWHALKHAASEALLRHQATITHHHAVGRVHKPYYLRQSPPLFQEALQATKRTLDPQGILNPGVLIQTPTPDTQGPNRS